MSAEHERVKDPLPIRPPRPHPQGFICRLDEEGHKVLSDKVRKVNHRSEHPTR
ncbi:hypothetical protein ACIF8T_21670 [Streptomyces sp. NPDC085946]|uniref:hypothetical protein n=1 Tax=Streptomyces sp. NPDC085946 TaxID=3365744 RepID=UPI0037D36238